MTRTLFWNVDTQRDFMEKNARYTGTLYLPNVEEIVPRLRQLTGIAAANDVKVVNTGDWHNLRTREIKSGQFPPHCMEGSYGAQFIDETNPENPYIISWKDKGFDAHAALQHRNILLYKDEFDIFHPTGGPHTKAVLDLLKPENVFVYGVATNVCVNDAVLGLLSYAKERHRDISVTVVADAIWGLPDGIPDVKSNAQAIDDWRGAGAKFTTTADLEQVIKSYR